MTMSIVGSTSDAEPTGSSQLIFTKPVLTASGDVILVSLTANKNTWTVPSGFTQIITAEAGSAAFRSYLYYKVAGSSEPSTYTFTKNTDTLSPLAGTMVVVRGCDSDIPVQDSDSQVQLAVSAGANPGTDVQVTRSANPSRVLYWRTARNDTSTNHSFSEGDDAGNGYDEIVETTAGTGGVRYGAAVYSTGDYLGSTGTAFEPGGGILDTASTSDNLHFLIALQGANQSTVNATLPSVSSDLDGERQEPSGSISASLPSVTSEADGTHHVPSEGSFSATLPSVSSSLSGHSDVSATLTASIVITTQIQAETRQFGEHVILVEPDHRAFLVVDDGTDVGLKNIKRSQVTQE